MAIRIKKPKFDLYTIGTRSSALSLVSKELSWWSDLNETIVGLVAFDLNDHDYSWVLLARDELGRFRAVDLETNIETERIAEAKIRTEIEKLSRSNNFQGFVPQHDVEGKAIDLLTPISPNESLHPGFINLINSPGKAPARQVIREIAPWLYPADNHFVKEFQCHQFDQRLWELYLWSAFRELGYDVAQHEAPDFECLSPNAHFTVEATTVGPSLGGDLTQHPNPESSADYRDFLKGYMPIKFGSALTSKLNKVNSQAFHYWQREHSKDKPFILAIADFHKPGNLQKTEPPSMIYSQEALSTYLYGCSVDWGYENQELYMKLLPMNEHKYKNKNILSGFFGLPEAENISAVLFSNAGTTAKFTRIGVLAGFGAKNFQYLRLGIKYDPTPTAVKGKWFEENVKDDTYSEYWSDELQIFHNPRAIYPLPPEAFSKATNFIFQDGDLLMSDNKDKVLWSYTTILPVAAK